MNLGTAVRRLKNKLNSGFEEAKEPRVIAQEVVLEARAVHDEDLQRNKHMEKWSADWILNFHHVQSGVNVLTVCNTGSLATSVRFSNNSTPPWLIPSSGIRHCSRRHHASPPNWEACNGILYTNNTIPPRITVRTCAILFHCALPCEIYSLTAHELQTLQIPSVMICDTMVGSLFQHHKIHAVGPCPRAPLSLFPPNQ